MKEEFRYVIGSGDRYMVSNFGTVISCPRYDKLGRFHHGGVLKQRLSLGYPSVMIRLDKDKCFMPHQVHRLVAEAFIPRVDGKNYVDHIDGSRDNNIVTNLRWCTPKENVNFPIAREKYLKNTNRIMTSEKVPFRRPVEKLSKDGVVLCKYNSVNEAAKENRTTHRSIVMVANGQKTDASGFLWRFAGEPKKKLLFKNKRNLPTKPVICLDKDGTLLGEFLSITEASVFLGLSVGAVSLLVNHKSEKTRNGLTAIYKHEFLEKQKNKQ